MDTKQVSQHETVVEWLRKHAPIVDFAPHDAVVELLADLGMTFSLLRRANVARCDAAFHPVNEWSATDWATAMADECGEACNLIKKMRRGEPVSKTEIAHELADLVTYADLLAAALDIDLGEAVREKFNVVSERVNAPHRV